MGASPVPYTPEELFAKRKPRVYVGRQLDEIAFPLGGIGTGSISLGGWGQLRDWEIMNRPNKGYAPRNAFFTLRIKLGRKPPIVRVLQGPAGGSFVGDGHSSPNMLGEGLPRFRNVSFVGEFPLAIVNLSDPRLPIKARLTAFNPFIPLNDKESSIPTAILLYELENICTSKAEVMLIGNLPNIIGDPKTAARENEAKHENGLTGLHLSASNLEPASPQFGTISLSTTWPDAAVWRRWLDDRLSKFWEAVAWSEKFPPEEEGKGMIGSVIARAILKPGESVRIPFLITWHFPNFQHWRAMGKSTEGKEIFPIWRNYYATLWSDSWDVARYVAANLERLREETVRFHDALFSSTLPSYVLDAVSSQISILKTPTCLRLEDGSFYGFEGCNNTRGCCEGSCTHVWNYAQALPYLFPKLQRSMREAEYTYSMREDGFVQFRIPLPLGTKPDFAFHPAADGQMGAIMQVYREWLISGDTEWLRNIWPKTKRALEFAWKYWDADKDGVMEGMQHNTYDIEFYGPNTMMGSLYLGALAAAEKMARALGENEKAEEYRSLLRKGSAWTDQHLFNGEYYEQKVEPRAHEAWPEPYRQRAEAHGKDDRFDWPKWQYGRGCLSDQLIGQWYATMLGLGYLYRPEHVRKTLRSIFKYNWRANLFDHPGLLRLYALNDEAGLLIATWPRGERPGYAFYFADEIWCGIEYQVASHLIYEGMVEEGLAIALGVRSRYDGVRRNPWDEIECGHHYARSMASYALLTALSGFSYSAPERRIGFAPRLFQRNFRVFFCVESGWGRYAQKVAKTRTSVSVEMEYGSLTLRELTTSAFGRVPGALKATVDGRAIEVQAEKRPEGIAVKFPNQVKIEAGQRLTITMHQQIAREENK